MPVPVAGPGPRQLGGLQLKVVSLAWPGTLARGLRWRWQREAGAAELAGGLPARFHARRPARGPGAAAQPGRRRRRRARAPIASLSP